MNELLDILQEMHSDVDFENCDSLIEDGILDSFDIVTLIARVQDVFDVKIGAEHITPENFSSAETIWELIKKIEDED